MTKRERSGFARTMVYFALAVAGLAIGLMIYILFLLGQPLRTRISLVDPAKYETISLDEIQLAEEDDDVVPWDQGGRTRVYVHPDFPIKKVSQKDPNVENILIFGVDARSASDVACRADSLVIVTIDKTSQVIKLTSIMRDTRVAIDGRSKEDRINAAYAYGGVGLLINTINDRFELDIQRFAMFDFWSAASLIDSVGGIELEIREEEIPYLNSNLDAQNRLVPEARQSPGITSAGLQELDGQQAIAWARIRKLDSDYMRTSRQRMIITTLLKRYAGAGSFSIISLINNGMDTFETNMRSSDMIRLGAAAMPLAGRILEYRVPEDGMYKVNSNPWMMIVDWKKQVPALHEFIWGED